MSGHPTAAALRVAVNQARRAMSETGSNDAEHEALLELVELVDELGAATPDEHVGDANGGCGEGTGELGKIEVVVIRDPDGYNDVTIYRDGEPLRADEYYEYLIDAGAGHEYSDWLAYRYECMSQASESLRPRLTTLFDDPPGRKYIENWPG